MAMQRDINTAAGQGNNGRRKQADGSSDFVANTQSNNGKRKGKSSAPILVGQNSTLRR